MTGGARILIVEDSPVQADVLRGILAAEGYDIHVARDGAEGLKAVEAIKPALVVSDILMPEMDGYQMCRLLKENRRYRDVPVMLLTSLTEVVDVIRGLECGADNLVTKPYERKYLLSRVAYLLANRNLRESDAPRSGVEIFFAGQSHLINSDRLQILNLLLSIFDAAVQRNHELTSTQRELRRLNEHLEERVRKRTKKVRQQAALLEITQDAVLVQGSDGEIGFWNRGAERLYGWTAAEVLGKSAREVLFQPVGVDYAPIASALQSSGFWSGEVPQGTKDGKRLFVQGRYTLAKDERDGRPFTLMVHTDVTETRLLEEKFLRAQRMESLGTLAGGIAHDLNNVLSPILLTAEILRKSRGLLPGERALLDSIETSVQRGAKMVKQILLFARGAKGQPSPVNAHPIVFEVETMARETFPKSIEVKNEFPSSLMNVHSDPTQLHQVLLNLCVNARDAMPDGGRLTIRGRNFHADESFTRMRGGVRPGRYVAIEVSDTGTGMSPQILEKIYEPFFTTKDAGKGTGLGLSTVVSIVNGHRGFMDVKSELGKGSSFTVYFPAAEGAETRKPGAEQELPLGHGETILVVDDEATIRDITRGILEAYKYRVITAPDGAEAIGLFAQNKDRIRAVLLDMSMPHMDGPATIRALQKIQPGIKIIAASGMAASQEIAEKTGTGVHGFLQKPYGAESLLQTLEKLLGDSST